MHWEKGLLLSGAFFRCSMSGISGTLVWNCFYFMITLNGNMFISRKNAYSYHSYDYHWVIIWSSSSYHTIIIWIYDYLQCQVDRLSREHQREADNLRSTINNLQDELENVKTRSAERIGDLESTYEHFKRNSDEQVGKMMQELQWVL